MKLNFKRIPLGGSFWYNEEEYIKTETFWTNCCVPDHNAYLKSNPEIKIYINYGKDVEVKDEEENIGL